MRFTIAVSRSQLNVFQAIDHINSEIQVVHNDVVRGYENIMHTLSVLDESVSEGAMHVTDLYQALQGAFTVCQSH